MGRLLLLLLGPVGQVPCNGQPYATIVTKDYPDSAQSRLGDGDRWRLNVQVESAVFTHLLGYPPEQIEGLFLPHPLYWPCGWVCM